LNHDSRKLLIGLLGLILLLSCAEGPSPQITKGPQGGPPGGPGDLKKEDLRKRQESISRFALSHLGIIKKNLEMALSDPQSEISGACGDESPGSHYTLKILENGFWIQLRCRSRLLDLESGKELGKIIEQGKVFFRLKRNSDRKIHRLQIEYEDYEIFLQLPEAKIKFQVTWKATWGLSDFEKFTWNLVEDSIFNWTRGENHQAFRRVHMDKSSLSFLVKSASVNWLEMAEGVGFLAWQERSGRKTLDTLVLESLSAISFNKCSTPMGKFLYIFSENGKELVRASIQSNGQVLTGNNLQKPIKIPNCSKSFTKSAFFGGNFHKAISSFLQ